MKQDNKKTGFWAGLGALIAAPFVAGMEFVDARPSGSAVRRHAADRKFEVANVDGTHQVLDVSRRASTVRRKVRDFESAELAASYALGASEASEHVAKLHRREINSRERAVATALAEERKSKKKAAATVDPLADPLAAPAAA